MSNGKRVGKCDVVILSIKPQRPDFPTDQKHISIKLALQEWDKLDAYYRGQILKLKNKVKDPSSHHEHRKSKKAASESGKSDCVKKPSSAKTTSSCRRRSTSGHQLIELFGDTNRLGENDCNRASDEENRHPSESEGKKRKHRDGSKKSETRGKEKSDGSKKTSSSEKKVSTDEENYLSVPRDNFVIEFAIGEKKRTPIHRPDPPGFISPIKVEPYKPPIAIGLNGVHIQKILYHKSDSVSQLTSPTTTTASLTPDATTSPDSSKIYNQQKTDKPPTSHNQSITLKRKMDTSHSTTTTSTSSFCEGSAPAKKLAAPHQTAVDHDGPFKIPSPPVKQPSPNNTFFSITDQIIQKSKALSPELKERDRLRKLESQKRKAYTNQKSKEHSVMDSVDVSMKAMEMIWTQPLLSPLRSP